MRGAELKPVFLLGATAAGKTAISLALAEKLPVQIISVDSALIYRSMDIGTAKPDAREQALAPHSLIDIIEPWESYSVSRFVEDAHAAIREAQAAGRLPLLTGGTMMYYKALSEGLNTLPAADAEVRAELARIRQEQGSQALHGLLAQVDPVTAARLHPNDPQRVQRALEVYRVSGKPLSQWHQEAARTPTLDALKFALFPQDRSALHARIGERFEAMLKAGFVDEVEALRADPRMRPEFPSMRCVGYRQVWDYLDGAIDYPTMAEKAKAATRQLAKRQITWMRSMDGLSCFDTFAESPASVCGKIYRQVADAAS
ncbi:tRNA (adenosine(37)-N6)-dimethylallyltransferase MiaA [Granulosicoccaceae sp. 1_MG-2023]|nr:tRNA (adenosine(37)-N6)-dimethylallyltransferase MiaA [Granulosicoccaceae sp. 1_MG-2023]